MQTALAAAPGLVLFVAVVGTQIGVGYDSVYYLTAAESLHAMGRLVTPIATHAAIQFTADGTSPDDDEPANIATEPAARVSITPRPIADDRCCRRRLEKQAASA